FQAEDGIRDLTVTGVQTCALPIWSVPRASSTRGSVARLRSPTCCRRQQSATPSSRRKRRPGLEAIILAGGKAERLGDAAAGLPKIGRASCRERGEVWVGRVVV